MATASGPQVGTAWIAITPSFQGFGSSVQSGMTDELTQAATRAGDDAGQAAGDAAGNAAGDTFGSSFSDRLSGMQESLAGPGAIAGGVVAVAFGVGLASAMDTSAANARVSAQLGLTEDEAERVGNVAGEVFTNGWGASMDDAAQAVGSVITSVTDLGDVSDDELTDLTAKALALADVFQWDVGEATTAAGTLIRNDLVDDATEAFDVMTAAAQAFPKSMVADIPATVQEYSEHFERLGLDAQTSFGMMSQFVQAGGRDIDQAADVIHEFARITSEDTAAAAAAFEELGLDADATLGAIHDGGPQAADAMGDALEALRNVEDPADRARLAVELFGDMAGESSDALFAMDPATAAASASLDDVTGSADDLTTALGDDPGAQFEGALRQLSTTLGEALLPVLTAVADWATENPGMFQAVALGVIGAAGALAILTAAIWAMNVALAANPITWIILGVILQLAIFAAWVYLIVSHWDTIVAATTAAWDWIYAKVSGIIQWLWDLVVNWSLPGLIIRYWDTIVGATRAAWDWVWGVISGVWGAITGGVSSAAGAVWRTVTGAWQSVREATSSAWRRVRDAVTGALNGALDTVRGIGRRFVSIGEDIVSGIVSGVRNGAGWLYDELRNLASNALDSAMDFLGIGSPSRLFAQEVGQWIPAGVAVGVEQGEPALSQTIGHMVQIPDPPTVRAAVATGAAATAAPTLQIVAGDRHLRAWLEDMVRTQLGGDVTRLGKAR